MLQTCFGDMVIVVCLCVCSCVLYINMSVSIVSKRARKKLQIQTQCVQSLAKEKQTNHTHTTVRLESRMRQCYGTRGQFICKMWRFHFTLILSAAINIFDAKLKSSHVRSLHSLYIAFSFGMIVKTCRRKLSCHQ